MLPVFWFRWLQIATIGIIAYGVALFAMPGFGLDLFSFVFFGGTGGFESRYSPEALDYIRFIHGDLGSVIVGWGVTFFLILNGPFRRLEPGGWAMLVWPVVAWFITAAVHSVNAGYVQNIIFNLLFLTLFALPLAATRNYFKPKS
jgi:hypothetical protein